MPTYDYECKGCGTKFDVICRIADMDVPKECPECHSNDTFRFIGGAPAFGDSVRLGITRPDQGFKEVLQKIHKNTPGSQLDKNSRYI